MTAAKKCVGFCLLCGGDIMVDPTLEDHWQDAEAWILDTTTHNCEPGCILQEHGSDALDAWQAKQPKDPSMQRYENMSFEEYIDALVAEAEAKASPLNGPGTDLACPSDYDHNQVSDHKLRRHTLGGSIVHKEPRVLRHFLSLIHFLVHQPVFGLEVRSNYVNPDTVLLFEPDFRRNLENDWIDRVFVRANNSRAYGRDLERGRGHPLHGKNKHAEEPLSFWLHTELGG